MKVRLTWILFAAFCLTGGVLGYTLSQTGTPYHRVAITLESSMPAETQLFYNTGKEFNENDSLKKIIYQVNTPVTLDFNLSGRSLYGLRFDPSRSPAKLKIYNITIQYHLEKPYSVPLDSLKAVKDIKTLHFDGKMLTVDTEEAVEDPILLLPRIGPAPHVSKLRILMYILTGAISALIVAFFIVWVYRNCINGKEAMGEHL